MKDALDVVQAFQDGDDGWSDNTMLVLLTDFINAEKLGDALASYLATRKPEEFE